MRGRIAVGRSFGLHLQRPRCLGLIVAVAALALSAGPAAADTAPACGTPVASGANFVVTCAFTSALQSWTVPQGVHSATIDLKGAQGGGTGLPTDGRGGRGGEATATIPVSPGDSWTVLVGGMGGRTGGYGGGGAPACVWDISGGANQPRCNPTDGGGGGESEVYVTSDAPVLVAGGGGGGGCDNNAGGNGGDGGGRAGTAADGAGGTQTGGGAGDSGGSAGGLGVGGAGDQNDLYGGAGGGGGYYGGGGAGCFQLHGVVEFGGGGGGSGYGPAGTVFTQGENSGNGSVTITFPAPHCGQPVTTGLYSTVTCPAGDGVPLQFFVPAGVSQLQIDAKGAQGGADATASGGLGGDSSGTVGVNTGDVLTVLVGSRGAAMNASSQSYGGGGTGGVNAGGGGGGSFVWNTLGGLELAAGGGGGAGGGCGGGGGGGPQALVGAAGDASCPGAGGGGSESAGGGPGGSGDGSTAGTGPASFTAGLPIPLVWGSGSPLPGSGGQGGSPAGGGGGGGYYGGGGGSQAGGGGGSGYVASDLTATTASGTGNAGDGEVTITYRTPIAPSITSAPSRTFTAGQNNSFTVATGTDWPTATSLAETGALPSGVTFVDNGDGTATLSGNPTVGGRFPITIKADNGAPPAGVQTFVLSVTAPCSGGTSTSSATTFVTCSGDDALQTLTVPADVHQVTLDVYGAYGGGAAPAPGGWSEGTLQVSPGDVITALVGGAGSFPGVGGYGGGGDGGAVTRSTDPVPNFGSGGGGGGSFVWDAAGALAIAAGGGGGASGAYGSSLPARPGGTGGYLGADPRTARHADGGTETTGGSSTATNDGTVQTNAVGNGPASWNGGDPQPGVGGHGQNTGGSVFYASGGGGGGYYGGAGAAAGGVSYGGGGGGSGYLSPALSNTTGAAGAPSPAGGDGEVDIAYAPRPVITSISPTQDIAAGGATVTITGQHLDAADTVTFGSTSATIVNQSATSMTVTAPAGTPGATVSVVASAEYGGTSHAAQFTYLPLPAVSSLTPSADSVAGGDTVTISGSGFTGATAVDFGSSAATNVQVVSDSEITATSPQGAPGTVDVTVTTPDGTSPVSPADEFTYNGVTPGTGPTAGGTSIDIKGAGFTGATGVTIGGVAATNVHGVSDTEITATTPAHAAGTVDVVVTTSSGQSPAGQFTYVAPPVVTGLSPAHGSVSGGNSVTITGTSLDHATEVDFGSHAISTASLTLDSATQIVVPAPGGAIGSVDVRVKTQYGTSATSAADLYTYGTPTTDAWSGPTAIDGSTAVNAVSCPTSSSCVAVDASGDALTYNGQSWTAPSAIDSGKALTAVSCPTSSFCIAVDNAGNALTDVSGTWSGPGPVDSGNALKSVSCPTSSFCVTVDSAGNALTYDGTSWSAPASIDGTTALAGVSCTTAAFCVAVDGSGHALRYDGTSWSASDIDGSTALASVSCPTSTFCTAVDAHGNALQYSAGKWSAATDVDGSKALTSIACSNTVHCTAVDNAGNALTYNSGSWSTSDIDGSTTLTSVSCPTTAMCVAGDTAGSALRYDRTSWSGSALDPYQLNSVSCPTTTFCAAVGNSGNAYVYASGAWSPAANIDPQNPVVTDGPSGLVSVSCPSVSFCLALDYAGSAYTYTNGIWTPAPSSPSTGGGGVSSVSCTSSSFCMEVEDDAEYSTFNGTSWSPPNYVAPRNTVGAYFSDLVSVSCVSSSNCSAVDYWGLSAHWSGSSWQLGSTYRVGPMSSISCRSNSTCIASGPSGAVLGGAFAMFLTPGGMPHPVAGVSCAAAGACGVISSDGSLMFNQSFAPDSNWTTAFNLDPAGTPTSISCPVALWCSVVDAAGRAYRVDPVPATTTMASADPSSATEGDKLTYSATVGATNPAYGAPSGTVTFTTGATTLCTATLDALGVGSCSTTTTPDGVDNVQATYSGDTTYFDSDNTPGNVVVSIGRPQVAAANQTITFTAPAGVTYGDPDTSLGATASSGLDVSYSSTTPTVCTIDPTTSKLHVVAAGQCTIAASQAGNGSYNAAPEVDRTFPIAPKAVHVDATPDGKTYGAPDPSLAGDFTLRVADFVGSDAAVLVSGTAVCSLASHGADAGTYTGAISCAAGSLTAANYTFLPGSSADFTIAAAGQSISFTAPTGVTFGDSDSGLGATASSGLAVTYSSKTTGVCTMASNGELHVVAAGQCTIDAYQAGNGDYNAAPEVERTFTIAASNQSISFTAPTGVTYGDSDSGLGATASSGVAVTYTSKTTGVCTIVGGKLHVVAAGQCTIDADQTGNSNYNAASTVERTFTVAKEAQAISISTTPPSPALYGGTYAPAATGGGSGNAVTFKIDASSAAGACGILGGQVRFTGAGLCVIDANQAGSANYAAAPQKQQSVTIGFSKSLSGKVSGPLTVAAGQAVYLAAGTTVSGSVTVQAGGALSAQGTVISGTVSSSGATSVRLCATKASGAITITKTAGLVVVGDDDGSAPCAGNTISSSVSITGNLGGVEFDGNIVSGPLTITGNTGTLLSPDTGIVDASGNKVSGTTKIS